MRYLVIFAATLFTAASCSSSGVPAPAPSPNCDAACGCAIICGTIGRMCEVVDGGYRCSAADAGAE